MSRDIDRRDLLKGAAGIGVVGMAGCLGEDDEEDPDDEAAEDAEEEEVDDEGDGTDDGEESEDDADDEGDDGEEGEDDEGDDEEEGADDEEEDVDVDLSDHMVQWAVMMPETGDLGSLGPLMRDGALLVEEQLSEEAGLEFDVETGDTETDPEAGISTAQSLVDGGYPAIVGPAASNVNLQVTRQAFIPNQVIGMSPSSTAPAVTDLDDDDYIFRTAPSDALQGPVMGEVAAGQIEGETASTLYLNDDYGQALEESFVEGFEDEGGEVLNRVSFEPEQASYSSQIGEALGEEPDVLMVVGFPQSGITLFRDYYSDYADDWDGQVIVPDGLIDEDLPDEVGDDMEDVWGTAPSAAGPGADRFAELYQETWDTEPGVFNSHAYDAAAVLTLANLATGEDEPDGTAVRDEIRNVANPDGEEVDATNLAEGAEMVANGEEINYQGASSAVNFDDNGDMEAVSYDVMRFQGGGIEVQGTIDFEN